MCNKVFLMWNLTKDIELKTSNNLAIANTSIAINENYKDKEWNKVEKATFINLVAFWHTANHLNKRFKKWSKILIEWKISTSTWDKEDWTKWYKTEVIVEQCHFAGWKSDWNDWQTTKNDNIKKENKKEEEISIEDIPF